MSGIARCAEITHSTARVDLADDASSNQFGSILGILDDPDKLMTDGSIKAGVTARDLEIGIAHTGSENTNQRLSTFFRHWDGGNMYASIIDPQGFHTFVEPKIS